MEYLYIITFGAICGALAYHQRRNPWWGIFFGMIGGLISMLVYLIIGKKDVK